MSIDYKLFTNIGSRKVNEDSVRSAEKKGVYCFILCDGLGGHGKGEVASAYVADHIKDMFLKCNDIDSFLENAFNSAQKGLMEEQKRLNATTEMKTTCTVLVVDGKTYRYGHIGDSRIYTFRKNKLLTRTLDHSVPQMLVLAGDIKEKKIRNHPDRNRLLRVMGVEWDSPRFELSEVEELQDGDSFLLCSDGFWELIVEKQMCKTLKKASSAEQWMASMNEIVSKNGKGIDMDNNSAIAVICSR